MYITDRFEITKRDFSPEGYLIVKDSKLARTGVLNYRRSEITINDAPEDLPAEQLIRVYRGPEELFRPEVLDSFKSKPITFHHPDESVDSSNIKDSGVGHSKDDVVAKGNFMEVTLFISDEEAIKEVRSGVKELSLGYTANITWRPGTTPTGEVYDAIQENIRGNHIAIVPKGRNGSLCKISDSQPKQKKGKDMSDVQIVLDSVSFDCPAQTAQAFEKTLKSRDSRISTLKDAKEAAEEELEDEKEKSKKEKDEMQAKLDAADDAKVSDADIEEMVETRSALMDDAKSVVATIDCKGKSEIEIKTAVVKDSCPDLDLESKSPEYIAARFDAILDSASKAPKKSAITDAMKDHAKGNTNSEESTLLDSGMSLSEKTRLEKINKNRTKYRGA